MTTFGSADLILRGDPEHGYELRDPATECLLAALPSLGQVIAIARWHGAPAVWQQFLDYRGRPLGPPQRLVLPPH
jgi:hypothetical protein